MDFLFFIYIGSISHKKTFKKLDSISKIGFDFKNESGPKVELDFTT